MNIDNATDLVESNLDKEEGVDTRARAKIAIGAALEEVGRYDFVHWNKVQANFSLTAGMSVYTIGDDILSDYGDVRGVVTLHHTDQQHAPIRYKSVIEFNNYARGSDSTGRPFIYTLYDRDNKIEFYYTPDANYTIWSYITVPLDFTMIPDDYRGLIIWRAVMFGTKKGSFNYSKARELYNELYDGALNANLDVWRGTRMVPEYQVGGVRKRTRVDSGNYYGLV